ncbi:hypothetical protein N431DRAFT_471609 [Stipitochalara longipes BDJ]|nr:hypothetical protein N431DRAFT_471609 [Stipitochalara longipes BDJ]
MPPKRVRTKSPKSGRATKRRATGSKTHSTRLVSQTNSPHKSTRVLRSATRPMVNQYLNPATTANNNAGEENPENGIILSGIIVKSEDAIRAHNFIHFFYSNTPPPSLLHSCQKSRREGFRVYKLAFGVEHTLTRSPDVGPSTIRLSYDSSIYTNWATDILCVMNPDEFSSCKRTRDDFSLKLKAGNLRTLAININYLMGQQVLGMGTINTAIGEWMDFYLGHRDIGNILLFQTLFAVQIDKGYRPCDVKQSVMGDLSLNNPKLQTMQCLAAELWSAIKDVTGLETRVCEQLAQVERRIIHRPLALTTPWIWKPSHNTTRRTAVSRQPHQYFQVFTFDIANSLLHCVLSTLPILAHFAGRRSLRPILSRTGPRSLFNHTKVQHGDFIYVLPKLPKEIQLNIWKEAAFETRNVGVWVGLVNFGHLHDGNGEDNPYLFVTNISHPAILHTSRDSRREGLKIYQLTLGSKCQANGPNLPPFKITFPARTYVN